MSGVSESLAWLCVLLFVDGATFAFATTPLLLQYGKFHPPWSVAMAGGLASALGSAVQLMVLRWLLANEQPWMRRFAPSRARLVDAQRRYPSASFMALVLARATPLPDAPLKLVAAAVGYPVVRYAVAIFIGAVPYYFFLAYLGRAFALPTSWLVGAAAVLAAGVIIDRWRRRDSR